MRTLHASERNLGQYVVDKLVNTFRHRRLTVRSPQWVAWRKLASSSPGGACPKF